MSWFKRIPHKHPPVAPATVPYRTSPATDHARDKAKESGPTAKPKLPKKTH